MKTPGFDTDYLKKSCNDGKNFKCVLWVILLATFLC